MKGKNGTKVNAKVILGKCPQTKGTFGMRIEEIANDWMRTWSFAIDEKTRAAAETMWRLRGCLRWRLKV